MGGRALQGVTVWGKVRSRIMTGVAGVRVLPGKCGQWVTVPGPILEGLARWAQDLCTLERTGAGTWS